MAYSQEKPFENREHIIWEIGYCCKVATYSAYLGIVFAALGIVSDALDMKLLLEPRSWLLLAIILLVGSMLPHLHMLFAKQLLGMEIIKKE
jgi:hypothetical protein